MKRFTRALSAIGKFFNDADNLAIVFVCAMVLPNIFLDFTEPLSLPAKIANILVPIGLWALLPSFIKRIGIPVFSLLIFFIMNTFQITLLYLFGEAIISIDMLVNCVATEPSEAGELLSNLFLPLTFCGSIYIPLFFWGIYCTSARRMTSINLRKKMRCVSLWTLVGGTLFVGLSFAFSRAYNPIHGIYPINVISNLVTAVKRINDSVHYPQTSADFRYGATSTHDAEQPEIHVLVIGETSRTRQWQLAGYERETNPKLSQRDDIIFYDLAIAQANTTQKCMPLLLTPMTPCDFDSLTVYKSIVSAFNEAGYETSWFSSQPKNHSYIDYYAEEADSLAYVSGWPKHDMKLIEFLKGRINRLDAPKKQFILLHTYGSHFKYNDRYPLEYSYFKPDAAAEVKPENRDQLINGYDNSIRYTDAFLDSIINTLSATGARATLTFVSDHGEDLYDDSRERLLHSSPLPTYYQLGVPMVFWTSESYDESYPDVEPALKANSSSYVASTESTFHTVAQLAGLSFPKFDSTRSLASPDFRSPEPLYLNDYNGPSPLVESGLKETDIDIFRSLDILK